ncbi:MAG: hypothetical protein Fues2KO_04430 [Fuerstiella sp.]
MPQQLYLDTARFGPILPECANVLREYATLLEEEGQFPQFDDFLINGAAVWADRLQQRFPTIARWKGLEHLKQSIIELCGLPADSTVLLASASRHLAGVIFRLLAQQSERVLCSDLDWPEFQTVLKQSLLQSGGVLERMNARIPNEPDESNRTRTRRMANRCRQRNCDGVLMTSVSNDGLPTEVDIFRESFGDFEPDIVVDASQHVGHLPLNLGRDFTGTLLGGTHKWLRSGVPLSFAVIAAGDDNGANRTSLRKAIRASQIDDPLLLLTAAVDLNVPRQTARIEPLLAAWLAIQNALEKNLEQSIADRKQNAWVITDIVRNLPLVFAIEWSNGIMRLRTSPRPAPEVQEHLSDAGLTVSVLDEDRLRISFPDTPFALDEENLLREAFSGLLVHYSPFEGYECDEEDGAHSFA